MTVSFIHCHLKLLDGLTIDSCIVFLNVIQLCSSPLLVVHRVITYVVLITLVFSDTEHVFIDVRQRYV